MGIAHGGACILVGAYLKNSTIKELTMSANLFEQFPGSSNEQAIDVLNNMLERGRILAYFLTDEAIDLIYKD